MASNHHGTLVILGDRGVLITGPSGSGKTTLALSLLRHCAAFNRFARLVSDDQVFVSVASGRIIGRAPAAIGGLAEARGFAPAPVEHEPAAVIDLAVQLVPAKDASRYQDDGTAVLEGIRIPCLGLAERKTEAAVFAVAARLSMPPFR